MWKIHIPLLFYPFHFNELFQKNNKNVCFSKIHITFPDTITVNKDYKGFVTYKSLFDSLKLKNGKDRFIDLYLIGSKNRIKYSDVPKIKHDTFSVFEDTIRFKIRFINIGDNFLNGHILDEVYIEKNKKIRIINKVSSFHKLVYVKR